MFCFSLYVTLFFRVLQFIFSQIISYALISYSKFFGEPSLQLICSSLPKLEDSMYFSDLHQMDSTKEIQVLLKIEEVLFGRLILTLPLLIFSF